MAAIAAAILSNVRAGDHVVAQTAHYTAALTLLTEWLPRQGVEVTQVDQTDIEAFRRAIGPTTRLVYTETPTNPTMALTDLEAVSAIARAQGAIVVTDNTFASSFNQRPLDSRGRPRCALGHKVPQRPQRCNGWCRRGVAQACRAGLGIRACAWSCAASDGGVAARARAQDLCAASAPAQSIRAPCGRSAYQGERQRSTIQAWRRIRSTNSHAGKCGAAMAACCPSRSRARRRKNVSNGLRTVLRKVRL